MGKSAWSARATTGKVVYVEDGQLAGVLGALPGRLLHASRQRHAVVHVVEGLRCTKARGVSRFTSMNGTLAFKPKLRRRRCSASSHGGQSRGQILHSQQGKSGLHSDKLLPELGSGAHHVQLLEGQGAGGLRDLIRSGHLAVAGQLDDVDGGVPALVELHTQKDLLSCKLGQMRGLFE